MIKIKHLGLLQEGPIQAWFDQNGRLTMHDPSTGVWRIFRCLLEEESLQGTKVPSHKGKGHERQAHERMTLLHQRAGWIPPLNLAVLPHSPAPASTTPITLVAPEKALEKWTYESRRGVQSRWNRFTHWLLTRSTTRWSPWKPLAPHEVAFILGRARPPLEKILRTNQATLAATTAEIKAKTKAQVEAAREASSSPETTFQGTAKALQERGQRLESLDQRTASTASHAKAFYESISQFNQQQAAKKWWQL